MISGIKRVRAPLFGMVLVGVALAATVSACAPMAGGDNGGHSSKVAAAKPIGAAVSCIPIVQISESRVQDDWTIDFRTGVRQWYRVTLPQRCGGLAQYRTFKYTTSLSELCNTDIIDVIETGPGGGIRNSCGLAPFQPIELIRK